VFYGIGLTIHVKMIAWGCPLKRKFWIK